MLWYVVLCSILFWLDARCACFSDVRQFYQISLLRLYLWRFAIFSGPEVDIHLSLVFWLSLIVSWLSFIESKVLELVSAVFSLYTRCPHGGDSAFGTVVAAPASSLHILGSGMQTAVTSRWPILPQHVAKCHGNLLLNTTIGRMSAQVESD